MTTEIARRMENRTPWSSTAAGLCSAMLAMILACLGCKHDASVAGDVDPVGSYTLVNIDGKALPCLVAHEGSPTVKSGLFDIRADGTCTSKVTFSTPSGGDIVRVVNATYTREGSKLTMRWQGAGTTTGRLERDAFTMDNEGNIFAYRK